LKMIPHVCTKTLSQFENIKNQRLVEPVRMIEELTKALLLKRNSNQTQVSIFLSRYRSYLNLQLIFSFLFNWF
jgi:hypothetical protein